MSGPSRSTQSGFCVQRSGYWGGEGLKPGPFVEGDVSQPRQPVAPPPPLL